MTLFILHDHFGVSASALSGVLAARERGMDLFGVLVLALVTSVGGGSLRDVLANDGAVFGLRSPGIFNNGCITAVLAFLISHRWAMMRLHGSMFPRLSCCVWEPSATDSPCPLSNPRTQSNT